ncbi:MFS transporter [Azotobacter chroococcum]
MNTLGSRRFGEGILAQAPDVQGDLGLRPGKFLTDPIWWLYLFWLPDFLGKTYGLDLKTFGPALIAIYILADAGSIIGGWGSSRQMKAGRSANAARKTTMLVCAFMVVPIITAQFVSNVWLAVLIIGCAAAAHQAWSANLMTLPSDLFPKEAVASIIGIGVLPEPSVEC